ncbi:MAG: xylulokinase [Thermoprotei archaeon]|nr:MAG: xylulokinase [Thermoprotei archaeon]
MEYLLGIDLGTTTAKAGIFSIEGEVVSIVGEEYPTYYPKPGWAEQDARDWWEYASRVIRNVFSKSGIDPARVAGISVSSHRESVVLLDKEGRPLDRVPIWMDKRSTKQAEWIASRIGLKPVYELTGLRVDPTFTATKLLWYLENKPEILKKAWIALQPKDYIVYKLTGEATTDVSVASRTLLFDIRKLDWSQELFDLMGISDLTRLFPEARYSDEIVGYVTEEAAKETGLKKGIPVVAGAGDRSCEVLGSGVLDPSSVEESTGTGSTTATTLDRLILDKEMRVVISGSAIRGRWTLEAGMATAGAILRWFRDQFAEGENLLAKMTRRRAYEYLDMEAEYIPPGSNGLLVIPFFAGSRAPRWNPYARGVIFGLTVFHSRAHVFRAMMEGIAFEIRKIIEVLNSLGINAKELKALGGGGKTPLWARIKADVTGLRVIIPEMLDAALIGDAILAGIGTKLIKSPEEGVRKFFRVSMVIEPDMDNHRVYSEYYSLYERLVSVFEEYFNKISKLPSAKPKEIPWDIDKLIHLLFKLEKG